MSEEKAVVTEKKPARKPRAARPVDHGNRVYVHNDVHAIGFGDFTVSQDSDGVEFNNDERTWSFQCDPEIAARLVKDYEFAAWNAGSVPLTNWEELEAEDLKNRSNVEVGRMAAALAQLAQERVSEKN